MSIRTKRAQRIALATAAALTATAGLAVGGGTASADLYSPLDSLIDPLPPGFNPTIPNIRGLLAERGMAGDIRVTPTDYNADDQTDYESNDQPFNFQLRGEDAPASDMQIVLKNKWEAGDQLKVILYPDGYSIRNVNGGNASYREDNINTSTGANCATPTAGVGWSSVPSIDVEGPFALNFVTPPPADPDTPAMAAFFNEGPVPSANYWQDPNLPWAASYWGIPPGADFPDPPPIDVRVDGDDDLDAPEFSASLTTVSSSGDCIAAGVTDVLTLHFENTAEFSGGPEEYKNEWIINLSDVLFDLGATVPSGPVHAAVFATDGTSVGVPGEVFGSYGSNMGQLRDNFITDTTIRQWTNPLFVQPAVLSAGAVPELLIDNTPQFAADVKFAEDGPDGFTTGCYAFEFTDSLFEAPAAPTVLYNGVSVPFSVLDSVNGLSNNGIPNDVVQVCITANDDVLEVIDITNVTFIGDDDLVIDVELLDVPGFGNDLLADNDVDDDESFFATHLPDDRGGVLLPIDIPLIEQDRALSNSVISDVNAPAALTDVYPPVPVANQRGLGDRIGGGDRYETAAKIANRLTECTDYAVIVSGMSYPDALSASFLAGTLASNYTYFSPDSNPIGPAFRAVPILTTPTGSLDANAKTFLRTRGVDTVYIVGGTAAVSQAVQDELESLPSWACGGTVVDVTGDILNVERVSGANRYETNTEVIELAQNNSDATLWQTRLRHQFFFGEASDRTALMASGADFPDAMTLGPLSYGTTGCRGVNTNVPPGIRDRCKGFPLILTTPDTLGDEAKRTLESLDIDTVVLAGGTAAVSAAVVVEIEAMGIRVIRLSGPNRVETAIAIADWARTGSNTFIGQTVPAGLSWNGEQAFLARMDVFADALAGAPIVAAGDLFNQGDLTRRNVLLLTDSEVLSPATEAWLVSNAGDICEVTALGLSAAIGNDVLDDAQRAIAGTGQCFFGDRDDDQKLINDF